MRNKINESWIRDKLDGLINKWEPYKASGGGSLVEVLQEQVVVNEFLEDLKDILDELDGNTDK